MVHPLLKLSEQLKSFGLPYEALLVTAILSRAEKKMKLFQDPKYQTNLLKILRQLGLNYDPEDSVDLLNAAEYLKEGATENNFLLAGLSIASLMPGLHDLSKIIAAPKLPADSALLIPAAKLIIKNQGSIKTYLDKLKDPKIAPYLKYYIPDGELLTKYSDRMAEALRLWSLRVNKNPTPVETEESDVDLEAEVDKMLTNLNSQL